MTYTLDLVVMVADADAEWAVRTLLTRRYAALGIRPIHHEVQRYPGRDAGVYRDAQDFLRSYATRAQHALVFLDREGCGKETLPAEALEADLEDRLCRNGWDAGRAAAIVLDPELEVWVWSHSPHVASVLGVTIEDLQTLWNSQPLTVAGKPLRPKETMHQVLRNSRRPASPRIFQELAERVSLQVEERAFDKFRQTLQGWFTP